MAFNLLPFMIKSKFVLLFLLLSIKGITQNDTLPHHWLKPLIFVGLEKGNIHADESMFMLEIDRKQIQQLQPRTTADLLIKQGGVFVQKSQFGGGSPILRGFEANRILLVVDGIRLNNLIFRGGHLQNIIANDVNQIEKMEVIFGPGSCLFGSDALGGVIEMETISPKFQRSKSWNTVVQNRFETVTKGWTQHFQTQFGKRNFAALTSFTMQQHRRFLTGKNKNPFYHENFGTQAFHGIWSGKEDVLMPNKNRYSIENTDYTQTDFLQKFKWRTGKQKNVTHNVQIQHSNTTNIHRNDRLSEWNGNQLKFGEWYYGPQKRLLLGYHRTHQKNHPLFQRNDLIIAVQKWEESRHSRKWATPWLESRTENVGVCSITQNIYSITKNHDWQLGWDYQYNQLHSTAIGTNKITREQKEIGARYPTGKNNMQSISVYSVHTFRPNAKWTFHDGLRGGFSSLYSEYDQRYTWLESDKSIAQQMPFYSGSFGLQRHWNNQHSLACQIASGYRIPNIDDLSRIFETAQGQVIVPNSNLKPEQSHNIDFSYAINSQVISGKFTVYQAWISNIIALAPFSLNGQSSILWDGAYSRVLANQNFDQAVITGIQTFINGNLGQQWNWTIQGQWTQGRINNKKDQPLDHIPPTMIDGSLVRNFQGASIQLNAQYNSWKRIETYRLNAEDNETYATTEGTPAFVIFNARWSQTISEKLSLNMGIENILNTQYRSFASGINGPGRNLFIAVRLNS